MTIILNGTAGITFPDGTTQSDGLSTPVPVADGGTGASTANAALTNLGGGGFGFKNRIINGAMMIDQRNAGASVTPNNSYTLDRWQALITQTSKYTVQQNAGAVTPPAGFTNYLGVTSSSAYSVVSGDYFIIRQGIEGLNMADLGWGTANASTVTLSFWVRSSLTGTFGGALGNNADNRSYPFTYTISAANTWEQKSVTIAGDTTGTWLTTNGTGAWVGFSIGTGTTYSGTAGAWAGANYLSATGATSVVGTSGATFYITGVQLEKGPTATSFDYRPYGTELSLCYRYYYQINGGAGGNVWIPMSTAYAADGLQGSLSFPVTMRTAPSLSFVGTWAAEDGITKKTSTATSFGGTSTSITGANMYLGGFTGLTTYRPYYTFGNTTASSLNFSAEL
jgi:hypothetical protein